MDEEELKDILVECEEMSETNCWWVEYQLKDVIWTVASNELDFKSKDNE
jgi:hypothetical protein